VLTALGKMKALAHVGEKVNPGEKKRLWKDEIGSKEIIERRDVDPEGFLLAPLF